MAMFRAIFLAWYRNVNKADKIRTFEIFESANIYIENQLINKIKAYTKLWYISEAGAKSYKEWYYSKYVSDFSVL